MQAPTIRFVRGYYYVSTGVSLARRTDHWRPSFAHLTPVDGLSPQGSIVWLARTRNLRDWECPAGAWNRSHPANILIRPSPRDARVSPLAGFPADFRRQGFTQMHKNDSCWDWSERPTQLARIAPSAERLRVACRCQTPTTMTSAARTTPARTPRRRACISTGARVRRASRRGARPTRPGTAPRGRSTLTAQTLSGSRTRR